MPNTFDENPFTTPQKIIKETIHAKGIDIGIYTTKPGSYEPGFFSIIIL